MAVTADEYELPIAVGDTAEELAELMGVQRQSIYRTKYREEKGRTLYKYAVRIVGFEADGEG